jgi:hypothetical protein
VGWVLPSGAVLSPPCPPARGSDLITYHVRMLRDSP